jgi:phosphoglycerate dehydrogenase-like enzyme
MNKLVLDMKDKRPVWARPDWFVDHLRDSIPDDWEIVVIEEDADGSGDGSARVSGGVLEAVRDARVYLAFGIAAEVVTEGWDLEWVHTGAAGVGKSLTPEMLSSPVRFTNSAGIHAIPMAETVLGMILYFARGLDFAVAGMAEGKWSTDSYYDADSPIRELSESVVGIIGVGGIGREIALRASAFGANVIGLRRSAVQPGERPSWAVEPSAGDIRVVSGDTGLDELLSESDYVVVSAPATPQTEGIISRGAIAAMRKGTVLINVSRGSLVDEDALVEALSSGHLRGAGLDVFAREPLVEDHALWGLRNVLVTPHVSAVTRTFWRREADLIIKNLRRLLDGEPLLNEVDKARGY